MCGYCSASASTCGNSGRFTDTHSAWLTLFSLILPKISGRRAASSGKLIWQWESIYMMATILRHRPPQATQANDDAGGAQRQSAQAQQNQGNIPRRPACQENRQIPAMQEGEQPALNALPPIQLAQHHAGGRINMHPGLRGIGIAQAQHRQAMLTAAHHGVGFATVVVEVIVLQ